MLGCVTRLLGHNSILNSAVLKAQNAARNLSSEANPVHLMG
jgi:hypothetical protein